MSVIAVLFYYGSSEASELHWDIGMNMLLNDLYRRSWTHSLEAAGKPFTLALTKCNVDFAIRRSLDFQEIITTGRRQNESRVLY